MKQKTKIILSAAFLLLFLLLILLLITVDVDEYGIPSRISDGVVNVDIGLSSVNIGLLAKENDVLFNVAEYLGYIALAVAFGFACLGAYQLVKRRSFAKVDSDIYVLAVFYIIVISLYFAFTQINVNCRPVFADKVLETTEPSFPSSHTMLAICVFVSAIYQFKRRISNKTVRISVCTACGVLAVATTVCRYLSGAHWFTDIVGAVLISTSLLFAYSAAAE